jgi:hypothetical protein
MGGSLPVRNLLSEGGLLGHLARRVTDPGTGRSGFRFTAESLLGVLRTEQKRIGFRMTVIAQERDLLLEIMT